MNDFPADENQIQVFSNFQDLVSGPFVGKINAKCWKRALKGDFSEIVSKIKSQENMSAVEVEDLFELQLTQQGQLAREILVSDLEALKELGASPTLNLIKYYERDQTDSFFPTDVYSFHVDRSPIPTDTFLCTYYGESSEILPNAQAEQKILVPEIRSELRKLFSGTDEAFESFLTEHFYDLHYRAKPEASVLRLGLGHLWRLAVDHPESQVLPCIHRAPEEKNGETRLLLIC